jgi:hypothetical protein
MLRQTGLEIFYAEDGGPREEAAGRVASVLFAFRSSHDRDRVSE